MIDALDKLAPEDADYRHNAEGSDDMVHQTPSPLVNSLTTCIAGAYQGRVGWDKCVNTHHRWEIGTGNMAGNIPLRI